MGNSKLKEMSSKNSDKSRPRNGSNENFSSRINSASEENNTRIWIKFRSDIDVDQAASDVREAVSRIERDLPDAVEQLSVFKADERSEEIIRIAVKSNIYAEEALNRVIEQDIVPRFISLPGVADVPLFGSRQRVLRIILDPLRLTSYGLTVADVTAVLRAAPLDVPAGSFRAGDQQLLVRADAAVTKETDDDLIRLPSLNGQSRSCCDDGSCRHNAICPKDAL